MSDRAGHANRFANFQVILPALFPMVTFPKTKNQLSKHRLSVVPFPFVDKFKLKVVLFFHMLVTDSWRIGEFFPTGFAKELAPFFNLYLNKIVDNDIG
jgi:hypothetical protein